METKETTQHALLAPSASHRWLVCSAEPTLRKMFPSTTNKYASEGTTAHWLAAKVLAARGQKHIGEWVGIRCPETNEVITSDMTEHTGVYTDYVMSIKGVSFVEQKFELPWISPELSGTADSVVMGSDGTLHVTDLKYGAGHFVEVENNSQLLIYGLGAAYKTASFLGEKLEDCIKKVKLTIVQPRCAFGESIRSWELSLKELIAWELNVLRPAVARAMGSGAPQYVAGEHCKFCPAMAICPAHVEKNFTLAKSEFGKPMRLPNPESLTPAEMILLRESAPMLRAWVDAVEEYMVSQAEKGVQFPGYKLVAIQGNRKWSNEEAARMALENAGIDPYKKTLLSVAEAEKKLKAIKMVIPPEYVTRPVTGRALVPESDKRPPIVSGAVVDFLPDIFE